MRTEGGNAEDGGRNERGIQGDAIRNITGGTHGDGDRTPYKNAWGAFDRPAHAMCWASCEAGQFAKGLYSVQLEFNAAIQVPTGLENRMINIKMRLYRKIAN